MKIIGLKSKQIFEIEPRKSGENSMLCPACSSNRKRGNQRKKPFSWNDTDKVGNCMNCDESFVLYIKPNEKEYIAPVWKNITSLSDGAVKWFTGRMISQATLEAMKVYSDTEWMPQTETSVGVICFPYFDNGKLKNIKFRDKEKNFKLVKDAQLILYNIDGIRNKKECIIVEGEMDALSYITCGITNVVSVPNGAGGNVDYLDDCIELFDSMSKVYIAVDNDTAGLKLRDELIRRIGQERCLIVNYKDKKDANEYLMAYGGIPLAETITNAIEIPVSGIINLNIEYDEIFDLFMNGMECGLEIGISEIDKLITWETRRLAVITGIPGHGKSEFVDFVLTRLNVVHKMKVAYFSPENYPVKYHHAKLASKLIGKQFKSGIMNEKEFEQAFDHIEDNFFFIFPEEDMRFETILDKAKYLVKKRGIKILVIDPYNKIEHLRERNESETEYISRFLDKLTMFARTYNVLVILVAHPRKMGKEAGRHEVPTLYDINGSANFYNKCDYGVTVYRMMGQQENEVHAHIQKIKFKHLGECGTVQMKYNYKNGRYEHFESDINSWDYSNYLNAPIEPVPQADEFWNKLTPNTGFDPF